MYILIILYNGEVEFTKICIGSIAARHELADWCCDNWHDDEDSSPEDFGTDDLIEWYFDHYEDYSYYKEPIQSPDLPRAPLAEAEDILLTPGMCAVIRHALGCVQYGKVRDLLRDHGELDENGDWHQQAVDSIAAMAPQFE